MKKLSVFIMVLAAVPFLMVGCKKEAQNASNVKFKLTDAPGQFDALNIDVQAIEVHTQGGGWTTFSSSLGVINILSYVNGSSTVIAQGSLQSGTIDQARLVLGSNNSVVVNGTSHQLSASSVQPGLTVNLNNTLQSGSSYEWTIDFDAAQSVTTSGGSGSGSFQFTPMIRLIVDPVSFEASGNISGSGTGSGSGSGSGTGGINIGGSGTGGINLGGGTSGSGSGSGTGSAGGSVSVGGNSTGNLSGSLSLATLSSVCITGSNGSSICSMTDLSGHFSIQAISSGSYTLTVTPVLPTFSAHTVSNINVTAGQTTNIGVISMQ